MQFYQISG